MMSEDKDYLKEAKDKDLVIACIHVINQHAEAEYLKEDDSYVCRNCRDLFVEKGFDAVKDLTRVIHRSHLGV